MERLCYISRNYRGVESSGNKAKTDNEETLVQMGATNLGLPQTRYNNKVVTFLIDLAGIIVFCFRVRPGDAILLQYPVKKYFAFICRVAHWRGARTMALIHDLGSFRRKKLTVAKEIRRLMNADYVIASNEVMAGWLREHGYRHPLGALGLFDYRAAGMNEAGESSGIPSLVYAGALAMRKNAFILRLPELSLPCELHIYGNRDGLPGLQENARLKVHGFMPADAFIRTVEGSYGLVWDGDSLDSCTGNFGEYLRWNSPHKVSFYLRASLPVIIWREAAVAGIIEREHAGLCISSLEELKNLLPTITEEAYHEMKENACRLSRLLNDGYFLREAIGAALQTIGASSVPSAPAC